MRKISERWLILLTLVAFLASSIEAMAGTKRKRSLTARPSRATAQARPRIESFATTQQAQTFLRNGVTRISQALECNC